MEDAKVTATRKDTVIALLEASRRRTVPIRRAFVQTGAVGDSASAGPLSAFVRAQHGRALDQYLLFHASASAHPFNVTRHSRVWARALGLGDAPSSSRAVSKNWTWLVGQHLVARARIGRTSSPVLLKEDASGDLYTHPSEKHEAYFQLPYAYWEEDWDVRLDLPAKAMLLIALSLRNGFILPQEQVPRWYGISADTAGRGLRRLTDEGILVASRRRKKAPLSPLGYTLEHVYTVKGVFDRGVPRKRRGQ